MPADFVLHSFRPTYGTRLGETGADAFTIMKLMGHSSVTISQPAARRIGVGTNLGTMAETPAKKSVQVI